MRVPHACSSYLGNKVSLAGDSTISTFSWLGELAVVAIERQAEHVWPFDVGVWTTRIYSGAQPVGYYTEVACYV